MRVLLPALLACRCPAPGGGAHFEDAGALRHAVYAGDAEGTRALAAALDGGAADGDEAPARLHAAVGFLIAAEDDAERGLGLAALARGCGECHAGAGVRLPHPSPGVGACADSPLADTLWWSLVAADAAQAEASLARAGPPTGGPVAGSPLERAEAVLGALAGGCGRCHRAGGPQSRL